MKTFYQTIFDLLKKTEIQEAKKSILHHAQNDEQVKQIQNDLESIFGFACYWGYLEIVDFLFTNDIFSKNINFHQAKSDYSGLHFAAEKGHLEIVKFLLTSPKINQLADVNAVTEYLQTPLMLACKHGHLDIVEFLTQGKVGEKINLYLTYQEHYDAFYVACKNYHTDIVNHFIFNLNFKVSETNLLKDNDVYCRYPNLKKRDAYLKMNECLANKTEKSVILRKKI